MGHNFTLSDKQYIKKAVVLEMKKFKICLKTVLTGALCLLYSTLVYSADFKGRTIEMFAGSASMPATREAAKIFEDTTGAQVLLHFGGSGSVLSQMQISGRGDVYFPGSPDFMELAIERSLVIPATQMRVAYLLPAIGVAPGNPLNIKTLEDLARPGLRVGIGRPDTVCVGLYGVEMLEDIETGSQVRDNIVNYAESCTKTAQLLSMGLVDAIIGWDVFGRWDKKNIEIVPIEPSRIKRIGYMPAAVAANARDPQLALAFVQFLAGKTGQEIFNKFGYLTILEEVKQASGEGFEVGGRFMLPSSWK
jgi:molybdate transport system substrate-binding protein